MTRCGVHGCGYIGACRECYRIAASMAEDAAAHNTLRARAERENKALKIHLDEMAKTVNALSERCDDAEIERDAALARLSAPDPIREAEISADDERAVIWAENAILSGGSFIPQEGGAIVLNQKQTEQQVRNIASLVRRIKGVGNV